MAQLRYYGHGPRRAQVAFSHSALGAAGAFEALAELFGAAASAAPTLLAGVDTLLETARLRAARPRGAGMSTPSHDAAPIAVLAAGCAFPAGPNLALADVAVRAALCLTRPHPHFVDRCGHRVRCSIFPTPSTLEQRWLELADAALRDLATRLPEAVRPHLRARAIPLWLVLPEHSRPGLPPELVSRLTRALQPNWSDVHLVTGQHAATAVALGAARQWIAQHQIPAAILAIDTPHAADTLAWLEARALLHHARTPYQGQARANPYGRIPGEAATALLLGPVRPPARCPAWCHVSALATADEPLTFDTEGPCVGAGLSAAAFAALDAAGHAATAIGQLIHDANGEPYRADEFGFTALRLADRLANGWRRISPALATGDLMSASLATQLAIAAWHLHQSKQASQRSPAAPAQATLLLASSDQALRAALVLTPAKEA